MDSAKSAGTIKYMTVSIKLASARADHSKIAKEGALLVLGKWSCSMTTANAYSITSTIQVIKSADHA